MDDWYNDKTAVYAPARLTADEAVAVYNAWMNDHSSDHAFAAEFSLARETYGRYVIFGEQYYYFHMDGSTYYWHNILVNMETGDLLSLSIDDGMFGGEYVMTMDDWLSITA